MSSEAARPRIAIGSIFQESNHFAATLTELSLFRNSYVYEGEDLFRLAGTDGEVSGMLAVCRREESEVVPLLAARAVSGGPLSDDCYAYLRRTLLERLQAAGTVDGVALAMHGAMAAQSEGDPEGDLLAAVRAIVGPAVPVVMTLDLHAHVTARMVRHATALVSFTHYPHDDTFTTGERGADLLFGALRGAARPVMAWARVPVLVAGCNAQTFGDAPMAHLTRRARELERRPGILSVSCIHVQAYLDLPDMGCGGVVVTDGDADLATRTALSFAEEFWARRHEFEPEVLSVAEALERARALAPGPVLLVDTADCAGGGAAGDSVALLRELLRLGVTEPAYVMVVDPAAARACHAAGVGSTLSLELGYHIDPSWGQPLSVGGTVLALGDGRFRYTGGLFGGTDGAMGPSAVLQVGSVQVLVMSQPTYDWADEQYRALGMDVRQARFVGVKNPMNYRFAYRDVARGSFIVDTPGPTPAHMRNLPYRRMQRPYFPLDDEIAGLRIPVDVNIPGGLP